MVWAKPAWTITIICYQFQTMIICTESNVTFCIELTYNLDEAIHGRRRGGTHQPFQLGATEILCDARKFFNVDIGCQLIILSQLLRVYLQDLKSTVLVRQTCMMKQNNKIITLLLWWNKRTQVCPTSMDSCGVNNLVYLMLVFFFFILFMRFI